MSVHALAAVTPVVVGGGCATSASVSTVPPVPWDNNNSPHVVSAADNPIQFGAQFVVQNHTYDGDHDRNTKGRGYILTREALHVDFIIQRIYLVVFIASIE